MLKKLRKTLSKEFKKRYEKMEGQYLGLENRIYTTIEERLDNLEKKFTNALQKTIKNYWSDENQNKLRLQRETINATYSWDTRSIEWKNFFNDIRSLRN